MKTMRPVSYGEGFLIHWNLLYSIVFFGSLLYVFSLANTFYVLINPSGVTFLL